MLRMERSFPYNEMFQRYKYHKHYKHYIVSKVLEHKLALIEQDLKENRSVRINAQGPTRDHFSSLIINPLAEPLPRRYQLYKRFKLFPWWLRYNIGLCDEAVLKDKGGF